MEKYVIDIHCHMLYGVDDGAISPHMSLEMLKSAAGQGIGAVIMTPHYRPEMFEYDPDRIKEAFAYVSGEAEKLGVSVFTGCEYHVDGDIVENLSKGRCPTLAGTDHVLTEYSYSTGYAKIRGTSEELLSNGYTPVIAHAERYEVFINKPELLGEFRSMGAMIQINADSIIGKEGLRTKRLCKTILKEHYVDIIASDCHNMTDRRCRMKECREYVAKKYGEERARRLFETNPGRILER